MKRSPVLVLVPAMLFACAPPSATRPAPEPTGTVTVTVTAPTTRSASPTPTAAQPSATTKPPETTTSTAGKSGIPDATVEEMRISGPGVKLIDERQPVLYEITQNGKPTTINVVATVRNATYPLRVGTTYITIIYSCGRQKTQLYGKQTEIGVGEGGNRVQPFAASVTIPDTLCDHPYPTLALGVGEAGKEPFGIDFVGLRRV